ncbi:MAG TPA: STAS domain-containing protein [Candidatus Binatia bacterium]|nr:STAS domain-containing protein [Candidatus Binatia bacterium]
MSMNYQARKVANATVLDVSGRIDLGVALAFGKKGETPLRELIRDFCQRGETHIVLNLKDVTYIDSSGIGELVASVTTLRNHGGDLKVVNPNMIVQKLLRLTRLDPQVIEVKPDEASALQSFAKTPSAAAPDKP